MNAHLSFGSYDDGPSVCAPLPKVSKSIKKELIAARAISAHEGRIASMLGLAPAGTTIALGFNDGIIYPSDAAPQAVGRSRMRLSRAAGLAPQAFRQLHALALLVDFSDNKGTRPAADFGVIGNSAGVDGQAWHVAFVMSRAPIVEMLAPRWAARHPA